jgi:hypothetical protein
MLIINPGRNFSDDLLDRSESVTAEPFNEIE